MVNAQHSYTVEQIRKGGDKAFRDLYLETRPLFLNYIKRYNLNEEEVKDVYQESFMVFYRNVITGKLNKLTSKVSTYVIGIGKYKAMELKRKSGKIVENELALEFAETDERFMQHISLEENEITEEQQLLAENFHKLGESCQEILRNFYYNGLTITEIMNVGGYKNKNTVKAQKSRCLKALKELINFE